MTGTEALLVLEDGTSFEGETIGAAPPGGIATGEVVFNTVLSGYQEVITDPSYAGQIVAITAAGLAANVTSARVPLIFGMVAAGLVCVWALVQPLADPRRDEGRT